MPDQVRFVLVRPEEPENVGAAARVLRNFGMDRLVLVSPRLGRPERAYVLAHRAGDLVEGADHVDDLDQALNGCVRAFATSRRSGKSRGQSLFLRDAAVRSAATRGPVAWVFGSESNGLTAEEISRCSDRVVIPTAPEHPSLNLAQSVALVAYELFLAGSASQRIRSRSEATLQDRDGLYQHLEQALLAIGFLGPETARARMSELRRLLERSGLSPNEVRFLRGIARRMERAAIKQPGVRTVPTHGAAPGDGNGE